MRSRPKSEEPPLSRPEGYLEIGFVRRAHGLRGQIYLQLHDPDSTALATVRHVVLQAGERARAGAGGKPASPRELLAVQALGGGAALVQVAGINDRDAAEAAQGCVVLAPRAELPALAEDEIYLSDVIGCAALREGGEVLGTISATPCLAGLDYLELRLVSGGEVLVPWVPTIVTALDLAARQVYLDPPEGLLELANPTAEERAAPPAEAPAPPAEAPARRA